MSASWLLAIYHNRIVSSILFLTGCPGVVSYGKRMKVAAEFPVYALPENEHTERVVDSLTCGNQLPQLRCPQQNRRAGGDRQTELAEVAAMKRVAGKSALRSHSRMPMYPGMLNTGMPALPSVVSAVKPGMTRNQCLHPAHWGHQYFSISSPDAGGQHGLFTIDMDSESCD